MFMTDPQNNFAHDNQYGSHYAFPMEWWKVEDSACVMANAGKSLKTK